MAACRAGSCSHGCHGTSLLCLVFTWGLHQSWMASVPKLIIGDEFNGYKINLLSCSFILYDFFNMWKCCLTSRNLRVCSNYMYLIQLCPSLYKISMVCSVKNVNKESLTHFIPEEVVFLISKTMLVSKAQFIFFCHKVFTKSALQRCKLCAWAFILHFCNLQIIYLSTV